MYEDGEEAISGWYDKYIDADMLSNVPKAFLEDKECAWIGVRIPDECLNDLTHYIRLQSSITNQLFLFSYSSHGQQPIEEIASCRLGRLNWLGKRKFNKKMSELDLNVFEVR